MTTQECHEKWAALDKTSLVCLFVFLREMQDVEPNGETLKIHEAATQTMNILREEVIKGFRLPLEMKVIEMTCSACPSQWEGETINGDPVYIRYRWGMLRCDVWGRTIFLQRINEDDLHGMLGWREMAEHLRHIISIPNLPKEA